MDQTKSLELLFQTLGNANRLRIIEHLGDREAPVSEIVRAAGLSQPLVSHHLKVLRETGILDAERKGPFVYYRLRDKGLLKALGVLKEILTGLDIHGADAALYDYPWRRGKRSSGRA